MTAVAVTGEGVSGTLSRGVRGEGEEGRGWGGPARYKAVEAIAAYSRAF
jgi:hypothetical protein